uniref:Uncharacterized protein n=1 Tax=Palpitomonas bilix TaxID=652834 RepID=A0A7S3GI46_9EUKA|mmetsp:Transcript_50241/g.129327  ORF Transcript_50241/g.129327 Transcript_50241/m.129327 type:complete len:141 (+) Transcript_50241:45-467(+)
MPLRMLQPVSSSSKRLASVSIDSMHWLTSLVLQITSLRSITLERCDRLEVVNIGCFSTVSAQLTSLARVTSVIVQSSHIEWIEMEKLPLLQQFSARASKVDKIEAWSCPVLKEVDVVSSTPVRVEGDANIPVRLVQIERA